MIRDGGPGAVRWACGARAVEAALLAALDAEADAATASPALLRRPVRVVVPSASLRAHVAAAWMRRRGRAAAGVAFQTLHAVATEALARCGEPVQPSDQLLPVLVRRHARRERVLRRHLEDLVDGYGVVTAAVTDFLDAGFGTEHAEPLADATSELAPGRALAARTQAVLRVAASVAASLEAGEVGHTSRLLARARDCIAAAPDEALPARAVFVHGFAEATGLASDLLEALVRYRSAQVFLDAPPDPGDAGGRDPKWRFAERLEERLASAAGSARPVLTPPPPPPISIERAPGAQAEVRAVAEAIRARIDAGAQPETLGIVARQLGPYRVALRQTLAARGIPFSGVGEPGSGGAARRRVEALLEVLQRRGRVSADRWLDAAVSATDAEGAAQALAHADLRLGLRHIGVVRLEHVARAEVAAEDVVLPVAQGSADDDEPDTDLRIARRVLPRTRLADAVRLARETLAALERIGSAARLVEAVERLRGLLAVLGWEPSRADCREVFESLDALQTADWGEFEPRDEELLTILRRHWDAVGRGSIGGEGGGVQVLNVMEARGRTFDALYLLGVNRDVFPRAIPQDPLLPDGIRQALRSVLPDLPVKSTGHEEERFLFAQLVASSPEVSLSWQETTDDGRERAASPFLERLRWSGRAVEHRRAAPLRSRSGEGVVGSVERALHAGLCRARAPFDEAFAVALAESCADLPPLPATQSVDAVVAARLAALAELDAPPQRPWRPGAYDGLVGAVTGERDPRRAPPYISTVEDVSRCAWQAFLRRLLRLEAPPDPLAALPSIDARLIGTTVHRALEDLVGNGLPDPAPDFESLRDREPAAVAWPGAEAIGAALHAAARSVLREEGIVLAGLTNVLARLARPYVERAGALDWAESDATVGVLGVEVEGAVEVPGPGGGKGVVRFRADRVDRVDRALRITDYKTGRPISEAVTDATRVKHHLAGVAKGRNLQAVAYALGAPAQDVVGRLLYLRPDLDPAAAVFDARRDDAEFAAAFATATGAIRTAWERGAVGPRLLDENLRDENPACETCEVAIACWRGDSGVRGRLEGWLRSAPPRRESAAEQALRALWRLRSANAMPDPTEAP